MKSTKAVVREMIREEIQKINEETMYDHIGMFMNKIANRVVLALKKKHKYPIENVKVLDFKFVEGAAHVTFTTWNASDFEYDIEVIIVEASKNRSDPILASITIRFGASIVKHHELGFKFTDDYIKIARSIAHFIWNDYLK